MSPASLILIVFVLALSALLLGLYLSAKPPGLPPQKTLEVDGWTFHYREQGRGPNLVLIHGIGASIHCWDQLEPRLTSHFRVVAFDLPGFGSSSKAVKAEYGLDAQAARVVHFLEKIGVEKSILVGHSMGGNIALWLGHLHPDRFAEIVAVAPAAHPKLIPPLFAQFGRLSAPASWMFTKPMARFFHRRTRGRPENVTDERILQSVSIYRKNPDAIKTFFAGSKAISDPRLATTKFDNRILVLWGERDRLVPRWVIDKLMPRLSQATLAVHPWAGHEIFEDDPEWTAEQIRRFLGSA